VADSDLLGRMGFVEELRSRMQLNPSSRQETRALVHDGTNGIGKTFGALKLESFFQNSEFLVRSVYIGFNQQAALNPLEKDYLQRSKIDAEWRVQNVIFTRLCAAVRADAGNARSVTPCPVFDKPRVFNITADQATALLKQHVKLLTKISTAAPTRPSTSRAATVAQPVSLKEGKKFVLFAIVDEGQFLDDIIAPEARQKGGARLALRCLRELQFLCRDSFLLLPLLLGTNPQTVLDDLTVGQNVVIGTLPCSGEISMIGMTELIKRIPNVNDAEAGRLAALVHPRVRQIASDGVLVRSPSLIKAMNVCISSRFNQAQVCDIFSKAILKKSVEVEKIPIALHKVASAAPDRRNVILDFSGWRALALRVECSDEHLSFFDKGLQQISNGQFLPFPFEENVAHVLAHLFELNTLPTTAKIAKALRLTLSWLPACHSTNAFQFFGLPDNCLHKYFPFDTLGTHKTACAGSLAKEVIEHVRTCIEHKGVLFIHCGGNAPLDFIVLYHTAKKKLAVWMADAKNTTSTQPLELEHGFIEKAKQVFEGIRKQCGEVLSCEIGEANCKICVITNAKNVRPKDGLVVINQSNFDLAPWNRILFTPAP